MFKHCASPLSELALTTGKKTMMDNSSGQVKFICKAINHSSSVSGFHEAHIMKL